MSDLVIAAIGGAIIGTIGALASAYALTRKTRTDTQIQEDDATAARRKQDRQVSTREGREIAGEYKVLYDAQKQENTVIREMERKCQREVIRLSLALVRHGIEIPSDSDEELKELVEKQEAENVRQEAEQKEYGAGERTEGK